MRQFKKRAASGFSLIELLIVITIIGVLTAVALPSYEEYGVKTRIAGMQRYALALTLEQEAFYRENDRFLGINGAERASVAVDGDGFDKYHFWAESGAGLVEVYITADMYPDAVAGQRMIYQGRPDPYGNITWTCVEHSIASLRMAAEYVPEECAGNILFQ